MKNNTIETMLTKVNKVELTEVANARLSELLNAVPTTDTESAKLFTTYVKSMAMGKTAKVVKAMMLSAVMNHLAITRSMSFEQFCNIVGEDKSNASKTAKVANLFYMFSDKFDIDVTEFTINQLTPFAGKNALEVQKVFNEYKVSPLNSVNQCREIAKCIKTVAEGGKSAVLATDYVKLDKCMKNGIFTPIEETAKAEETKAEETKAEETTTTATETTKTSGDITTDEKVYVVGDTITIKVLGTDCKFKIDWNEDKGLHLVRE